MTDPKALAELNVSLPASIFPEEERAFLFRCYKGENRLDFLDKIQYNWIAKKTERIRRHTARAPMALAQQIWP
ncbi:MAG: hypothetical protein R6V20_02450 [Desulfobia sp.]